MGNWKPRVCVAAAVILIAMVLTSIGFNSFIQAMGYLAGGYLFGTVGKELIKK